MKRRDFLAATAASALPLACRPKPEFPFPGELVGPDLALGHWLRGGAFPDPDRFEPVSVLIVGGGVAGLSAAWRLAGEGLDDFRVLELESEPGGTSRSGQNHVSAFPWAAHYIPVPDRGNHAVLRLLQECGVLEGFDGTGDPLFPEEATVRAPEERLFAYGQWWEGLYLRAGASAEDERQYHAFFQEVDRWAAYRDRKGRPAFSIPRSRCSDVPETRALDQPLLRGLAGRPWPPFAPPALAAGLRLPGRLRFPPGHHQRLGGPLLLRRPQAGPRRGLPPPAHLAPGQRIPRRLICAGPLAPG